jgi:hypothetical protein
MADMGAMEMPLPDNTLPMMTGFAQFGPVEMGGMFSIVKVRKGLARDDYTDPGPYEHPAGTVSYEWQGTSLAAAERAAAPDVGSDAVLRVRKPNGAAGGHDH